VKSWTASNNLQLNCAKCQEIVFVAETSSSSAAGVVSDTRKYDRGLTNLLHSELHWVDVPQWVQYRTSCVERFTHLCGTAAHDGLLRSHLRHIARRQHLRSAGCRQLFVPRHRRSMFGRRAFSVAGPVTWNSLPDYLRDSIRSIDSFLCDLNTFLFSFCQSLRDYALYKSTIDIDIVSK